MDSETLMGYITTEDIIDILVNELGSTYPKTKNKELIFQCVCHGSEKEKLYYYPDSQLFHCYTNCGTMSLFDLLMNTYDWQFKDAFNWVAKYKGIDISKKKKKGLQQGNHDNKDLEFLNCHLYSVEKPKITIPTYDKCVMNIFDDYLPSSWIEEEGMSEDILNYFNIKFYFNQFKAIIPHLDINGNLIGIQGRSFIKYEVENGKKYMPISIQGLTYRFPTHFNLYGIYQNKENIKRFKKCIIFESAKSVWLYGTYYGQENNIALASCGLHLSNYQRDMLLELGVEEVILAWDKQYEIDIINNNDTSTKEYKEFSKFMKSIKKVSELFIRYCEFSVILDWQEDGKRICYKDSPIDNGKEIFEELLNERYLIEDSSEIDELIIN